MPDDRSFGEIADFPPGSTFASRQALSASGVHRPTQAGISGSVRDGGADSIVVSGGYEDDQDLGDEIIYTGHGGRDPGTGTQNADQQLTRQNAALHRNMATGLPVRVIRGAHPGSEHAPSTGYRYDGLYSVEDCWAAAGRSGHRIIRFRLRRLQRDDEASFAPPARLPEGQSAPGRRQQSTTRVIRDTEVSRSVKELYGYRCQVCSEELRLPSGLYAEAAHIEPLGRPHSGPDIPPNVLCLCPNHHVLFDHGAFSIAEDLELIGVEGRLHVLEGHEIGAQFLTYHRTHYG